MVKRIFKWTSNIFFIFLLLISAALLFSILQAKNNPGQVPNILGYKALTVLTGSMEPKLKPGDLVILQSIDPVAVKIDDVITYKNTQNTMVTHRVVDLNVKEGETLFETKGDANNVKDAELVQSEQLVGSLLFSIPIAGYLVNFLKSPMGLILLMILPFLYLSIGVFNILFNNKKKQDGDISS